MNILGWLIVLIIGVTVLAGLCCLSDDRETKEQGKKLLIGWWAGILVVVGGGLAMTFLIKPAIAWVWELIF